ncbi:MAG: LPS export ABC transporter periplasmic protein LptC [Gammaproteobacteria bacterium]
MSIRRHALNTTGVIILALAVFYTSRFWPEYLPLLAAQESSHADDTPDYIITAFHAVELDPTGRLRYELAADMLTHYPLPERAELLAPEMVFHRNTEEAGAATDPWQLTAATGRISDGGNRVDLAGDVRVARLVEDQAGSMMLATETLTVYGREEKAVTGAAVSLTSALASLNGVGMEIDMAKGQMHLLSQVRGHYDPP